MFRKVVEDLVKDGRVLVESKYETMQHLNPIGDIQFIVMGKFLSSDNELPLDEKMIMKFNFWIKNRSLSEEKGFGLEQSNVTMEKLVLSHLTELDK